MGTEQHQIYPPTQASNGPKNATAKAIAIATVSNELGPPEERAKGSFRKESGPPSFRKESALHRQGSDDPKRSFKKERQGSFFLSKGSKDMKWQRAKMVVGALEVKSHPFLQPKEDMKPLYTNDVNETKSKFEDALQAWEDLNLKKSFTRACGDLPDFVCCCGLSQSDNASMIKQYVALLNDGWVKHANSKIKTRGFKIDAFLWNSQITSGKTSKSILIIRFFELSTYKFRRASEEGSLDLDDMLLDDPTKRDGDIDDSSHYSVSHNSGEDDPDLINS